VYQLNKCWRRRRKRRRRRPGAEEKPELHTMRGILFKNATRHMLRIDL